MNRIVPPESKRLPISNGDYVDVKARLNHGEREDYYAEVMPFVAGTTLTALNRHILRTRRVIAHMLGWSLTQDGKPIPYSLEMTEKARTDTLRSLECDTFDEIHEVIEAHEDAVLNEAAARKKMKGGAIGSPATSPSPVSVTGDTSGSENSIQTSTTSS